MESKAWMAPALRTATTAAPALRLNRSPLALATNPDQSMRALSSGVISEKYVGEPSKTPSAAAIFSMQLLIMSPSKTHLPFFFSWHWKQAIHPMRGPLRWTSSVSMPPRLKLTQRLTKKYRCIPVLMGAAVKGYYIHNFISDINTSLLPIRNLSQGNMTSFC